MRAAFPLVFVLLWSSAFITSKFIVAESTPLASLCFRFAIVSFLFFIIGRCMREKLTAPWGEIGKAAAVGALFHGVYLGGVFYAIAKGMPAGLSALIVTLQPVLTNVLAGPVLGERVSKQQWVGVVLGFLGVFLILGLDSHNALPLVPTIIVFIALLSITAATLWQKAISNNLSLVANNMYQALSAMVFHGIAMLLLEDAVINFTPTFIAAMGWQVIAVSLGAFTILMYLIKTGSASKTATLFFLVPSVSIIMAWLFANEPLTPIILVGLAITTVGVYIATRPIK